MDNVTSATMRITIIICIKADKEKNMFENLSDRLERSFKILKGEGKITR